MAGSILAPVASSFQLRRRNQQQCDPFQPDDLPCVDSLFVLLELKENSDDYSNLEQAFMKTYNNAVSCSQTGADRSINSVTVLDDAKLEQNDQFNGTSLLLEIDLSCNSCGQDYWQIFEGTQVGLDSKPSAPEDSNTCYCEGPSASDFVGALQDAISNEVVSASQIPLLYPESDDNCNDPESQTTFGEYGVCPGTNDDGFSCMFTEGTSSPTESPTSSPTYNPTSLQPGDCPGGYDDRVYIHVGCKTGKAGFAEDKDCPGGQCEEGPGYYCTDNKSVSKFNHQYDDAYICKDCASGKAYWDDNDQAWYCDMS